MSTRHATLTGAAVDQSGAEPGQFIASADLFDALRGADGKLPKDALRRVRHGRSRGRPVGARNKRSEQLAAYFVGKYGDPLDFLGEIMTTPLDIMVEMLALAQDGDAKHKPVRAKDAMEMKIAAAREALTYIHGKQPVSVEVTGRKDAVIIVPGLNAPLDISVDALAERIEREGVTCIDPETLQLLPVPVDAEYDIVDPDDGPAL